MISNGHRTENGEHLTSRPGVIYEGRKKTEDTVKVDTDYRKGRGVRTSSGTLRPTDPYKLCIPYPRTLLRRYPSLPLLPVELRYLHGPDVRTRTVPARPTGTHSGEEEIRSRRGRHITPLTQIHYRVPP